MTRTDSPDHWNPASYLNFGQERRRPDLDLLNRVYADEPRTVVDLGREPGNMTETLASRWPRAKIHGLDSSPKMIEQARERGGPVNYALADIRDYVPSADVEVIVSGSTLQWIPEHEQPRTSDLWPAVGGDRGAANGRTVAALINTPLFGRS